jgi:hypothetical protein
VTDERTGSEEAFEEARAALFGERPEDFVAARDRLVRELRARKERELAGRVAKLRRPTISLWLANRLHDVAGRPLRDLLSVGGELQEAQASAAGGDASARRRFRELIGRHSQLIDALLRAGLAHAEEQGYGSGEEVGRRLAATLRAASTEPGAGGRALLEGRLEAEPEAGGFDLLAPAGAAGFGTTAPAEAAAAREGAGDEPRESALEAAARAAEARRAAVESERTAVAARSRAEELSHRADALAREARKAREEADAAQDEARSAEAAAAEAQRAARDLEKPARS